MAHQIPSGVVSLATPLKSKHSETTLQDKSGLLSNFTKKHLHKVKNNASPEASTYSKDYFYKFLASKVTFPKM